RPISTALLNIPKETILDDPSFNNPNCIDLILGAEIFFDLIKHGQIKPMDNGPVLQNTHLGWVIAGPVPATALDRQECCMSAVTTTELAKISELEDQMAQFWRLEEVNAKAPYTLEETMCMKHYKLNVRCSTDGRFTVVLPFKDPSMLGKSYHMALRQFLSLERRLQADPQLKASYNKFIDEYIMLGHAEKARSSIEEERCYYMPHHAVINEHSTSTRLRVVFDASVKTDTGVSLNEVLLKGPCIQEELVTIMARFRTHRYVLTADIKKMYRQVWISESQRDFQRILWREDPSKPINIFCLKTITYGVITSSYLVVACLEKLTAERTIS
ncbi:uncharacterized protein LOC126909955, partial [Daktulosphaira vitifoliae]|uniref:uncharacterized protein LOC126909955 n=1 Tax=Daktulosphaira vitifoliae TaxID=58002 RepID=UPI0021AAD569